MTTISLKHKTLFVLKPLPPYNFDPTVFKPSYYPDPLSIYEPKKYWFATRFGNRIYGVKMENKGSTNKPRVLLSIFSRSKLSKNEFRGLLDELNFRFEFNRDISGFFEKFKNDRILSPFLQRWYGMHKSCSQNLYGSLMIGIFLQNTIVKRSVQMTKDMLEKYGIKVKFNSKEVYEFWKPEEVAVASENDLRKLKVGYRAKIFIKLSQSFIKEKIDELGLRQLPVEEAKKKLIKLYGVGPETARILLVEALHHHDVFDHVAPWQQKIYSRLFFKKKLISTDKIINYVKKKWGEWADLAAHYIWEDIFWQRKQGKKIDWLEKEIRL